MREERPHAESNCRLWGNCRGKVPTPVGGVVVVVGREAAGRSELGLARNLPKLLYTTNVIAFIVFHIYKL